MDLLAKKLIVGRTCHTVRFLAKTRIADAMLHPSHKKLDVSLPNRELVLLLSKAISLLNKLVNTDFTGKIIIKFEHGEVNGVEEVKNDSSVKYREG